MKKFKKSSGDFPRLKFWTSPFFKIFGQMDVQMKVWTSLTYGKLLPQKLKDFVFYEIFWQTGSRKQNPSMENVDFWTFILCKISQIKKLSGANRRYYGGTSRTNVNIFESLFIREKITFLWCFFCFLVMSSVMELADPIEMFIKPNMAAKYVEIKVIFWQNQNSEAFWTYKPNPDCPRQNWTPFTHQTLAMLHLTC